MPKDFPDSVTMYNDCDLRHLLVENLISSQAYQDDGKFGVSTVDLVEDAEILFKYIKEGPANAVEDSTQHGSGTQAD